MAGGVEFVEKQYEGLAADDVGGGKEARAVAIDFRYAQQIFRGQLAAQQRHAFQPYRRREPVDQRGLADARRALEKHRPHHRDMQQEIESLVRRQFDGGVHDESDGA